MELIKIRFYISFDGPPTFKNSRGVLAAAEAFPLNWPFIETGSPYLTPCPFRGEQNELMHVRYTFDKLYEIKAVEKDLVAEQLWKNYGELFPKQAYIQLVDVLNCKKGKSLIQQMERAVDKGNTVTCMRENLSRIGHPTYCCLWQKYSKKQTIFKNRLPFQ